MKKSTFLSGVFLIISILLSENAKSQTNPTIAEVKNFLNGGHFLVSYREGEVLYGTYYFVEIHYCPSGQYGLTGKSVKKTVMGNEQTNNWQEYGTWKVIEFNSSVGIFYQPAGAQEKFYPVYRLNGSLSFGQGVTVVRQGKAMCQ